MRSHPPRIAVALLDRFVCDDDPLRGDLLEEWPTRSAYWLWRQVLYAVLVRTVCRILANPRTTIEATLVAIAMLALISFQAVVVATLMNHLLGPYDGGWIPPSGRYEAWQSWFAIPSFAVAVLTGQAIGSLHPARRGTAVVYAGASATGAAFLNLYLFVPNVLAKPLAPDPALHTVVTMVFIAGLFAGAGSRPSCQESSAA